MTDFAHAVLPDGMRVYVVGDVHGCLGALQEVEAAIDRDLGRRPAADARIVLLGDYVDRGPDSAGVLTWIISRAERRTVIPLLGNHDDMLRRFLADPEGEAYGHWLLNGGDATLASLGLPAPMALGPRQAAERRALRDRLSDALGPRRRALLDGLRLMHRAGDFVFVHAGIRPGVALEDQDPQDLIWIREPFLDTDADLGQGRRVGGVVHDPDRARHVDTLGDEVRALLAGRLRLRLEEPGRVDQDARRDRRHQHHRDEHDEGPDPHLPALFLVQYGFEHCVLRWPPACPAGVIVRERDLPIKDSARVI